MHTLFAIEDMFGLKIDELDGEMVLRLDRFSPEFPELYDKFHAWLQEAKNLRVGRSRKISMMTGATNIRNSIHISSQ